MTEHEDLLTLARQVGREAAAFVADRRPAGRVDVSATKSSPTDVVTEIDEACERLIRERIFAVRPDDGFVGEEGDDVAGSSGFDWVVDPIDGTVNFVYGIPTYGVSIAARQDQQVVVGYVVNIASGAEWGSILGSGSWRYEHSSRRMLSAPRPDSVAHALVATGFNYIPEIRTTQAAAMASFLPQVRDIRRIGSAALDLCALAEGQYDAYLEQGLKPWDLAAGGWSRPSRGLS